MVAKKTNSSETKKMDYSLIEGKSSNYEIQVFLEEDSIKGYKTKILKDYQKDVTKPGFRKGHVPLNIVEEQVQPYYIWMGILEYAVNDTMKQVLKDNESIKFIGQPYDLNAEDLMKEDKKNGEKRSLTFKIDVYPEIKMIDDKRKKEKMSEVKINIEKDEIEKVMETMANQYAEYKPADKFGEKSISRVSITFKNKDEVIHTKKGYIGEKDFELENKLKKEFIGKKKGDEIELKYDEKIKIHSLHFHPSKEEKKQLSPENIVIKIEEIQNMELPKITDERVCKYFEKEAGLKTKKELEETIKKTITTNKEQGELNKNFESWLKGVRKSFDCVIPKYFVEEEYKFRIDDMKKQLGGDKGWENYLNKMGEKQSKVFQEEIKSNVKVSLENHFILGEVIKELGFEKDIDVSKGNVDRDLYEKLVGKKLPSQEENEKEAKTKNKTTDKK